MKTKRILDLETKQELLTAESTKLDWETDFEKGIIIRNKKLGLNINYYAVFDENDNFSYDTFGIEEREGNTVAVVLNQDNELCLIKEHRFMPDKYFLSCPRGFSDFKNEKRLDTALREVREEVGEFKVVEIIDLGNLYQNTTFFLKPIGVVLIKLEIDREIDINLHQRSEDIENIIFYKSEDIMKMISDGKIECMITLGALVKYFSSITPMSL